MPGEPLGVLKTHTGPAKVGNELRPQSVEVKLQSVGINKLQSVGLFSPLVFRVVMGFCNPSSSSRFQIASKHLRATVEPFARPKLFRSRSTNGDGI
nr:hypothetical protein [Thalassoroseus pseudoceratinae]